MKATVAPYETSTWCVRIECTNGTTVRLTTYPFNLVMSNSQVYLAGSGYDATAFSNTNTLAPAAIDLEGIADLAGMDRDAIASGVFDNARVKIFKCSFLAPVEDYEEVVEGFFGKTTLIDERYRTEAVSKADALNQSHGLSCMPGCRHAFGSQGYAECGVALGPITVSGTVTHVISGTSIRDSALAQAADYFGAGTIEFTSGANTGLKPLEIKSHAADGTLVVHEGFYYLPEVGDAFSLIPGCRKSREACRDKWNNILNFGGLPDLPLNSTYTQIGTNF